MQRTKMNLPNGHHVLYIRYFHRAKHIVFPRKKLTLKAPPIICRRQHFQILPLFQNFQNGMIFHENRLLADDSHEISYLIYFQKLGKMSQNLSSASVVIGSLRVITHSLPTGLFDLILNYIPVNIFSVMSGRNQYQSNL